MASPDVFPVSNSSMLVRFGDRIEVELSRAIAQLARQLPKLGIVDLVPSYTTLLVQFRPHEIDANELAAQINRLWSFRNDGEARESRVVEIPVAYGGVHGPDLRIVAQNAGMSTDQAIRRHSEAEYVVGAVGFSPGFGYLIGLPGELATPRLKTPRIRVPVGSVAIGGGQTGVYPVETPGGWNLIGRTSIAMFDPQRADPFLLRSGDVVRFRSVDGLVMPGPYRSTRRNQRVGGIEVREPGLLTTIQDRGRNGFGAFGIAPNGAADTWALGLGNRIVGNSSDVAGLEITLTGPGLRFWQGVIFALTGQGPNARLNGSPVERNRAMRGHLGDQLTFDPIDSGAGVRGYLCLAGGVDVPSVMGSRSTDLVAGIGGLDGRALRAGDVIPVGERAGSSVLVPTPARPIERGVLHVHPGPQREMFDDATWRRLTTREFTVTNDANRVGIRLNGPPLHPHDKRDIISEGVVTGSIQIPGSGQPIVLLPGRATIGGYPKIATVIDDDLDQLGQLRPGDAIRFRAV